MLTKHTAYNRAIVGGLIFGGSVRKKYYALFLFALGGTGAAAQALAQQAEDLLGLRVNAAIDVRSVDNAGLRPDSEEQTKETQTFATLSADGQLKGDWSEFNTEYRLENRRHSEISENDETVILGDLKLILGPQHRRYYLELSHSSREVSIDPLAEDLPSNRDNREIYSVSAHGDLISGRGNTLSLWAGASDIKFDENKTNESRRFSVGASFDHAVSPVSVSGVVLTGYELKYQNLDNSDVQYGRAAVYWRTALRRISYGAEIGGNNIKSDTDSTTSPSISADLTYRSGLQTLLVAYNQYLSDTSQGGQETGRFQPRVEVDGRLGDVVDQYRLQRFVVSWTHDQICAVCTMSIDLALDQETYVTFPELDSREMRTGFEFDYKPSRYWGLSLGANFRDFQEVKVEPRTGYDERQWELSVNFPQIVRNGMLELFTGNVKRDLKPAGGYDYNYVGARFIYRLYER